MNQKRIKVALVGAGGWGRQHARVLAAHPSVEFCALSGRSEEKTRRRAEEFGVRWYLDVGEMLDKEKPDLVNISLPNEGHYETTLRVIEAGYPLFVEKPLFSTWLKRTTCSPKPTSAGCSLGSISTTAMPGLCR